MFIFHGKRTVKIKTYTLHELACESCRCLDLKLTVFAEYGHLMFIPFYPTGDRSSKILCNNCKMPMRHDTTQREYEKKTRTPFYLFAGPLLIIAAFASVVIFDKVDKKLTETYVANPKEGDVYTVYSNGDLNTYSFLKVLSVKGDSVLMYHNNLRYLFLATAMDKEDFFVKNEQEAFSKRELNAMLSKAEIKTVDRNYSDDTGFNLLK